MATERTTSTHAARAVLCLAAALAGGVIVLAALHTAPPASAGAARPGAGSTRDLGIRDRCAGSPPSNASSTFAVRQIASTGTRSYGWPLKPFDRQHPVRGYFNDPRNGERSNAFHFGVDIAAADGTAVYAVEGGIAHLTSARAVAIKESSGRVLGYWHIVPVVRNRVRVARHQLIGHVGRGWGHVHFAESRGGKYANPLRTGALTPYRDDTAPTIARLRVERDELIVDAFDTTPVRVPSPWNDLPVTPVLVRWRVVGASGSEVLSWRTGADFRQGRLDASSFQSVYGRGTHKNAPGSPGRYCFRIGDAASARLAGAYRVQIAASDTAGNRTVATFPVVFG